MWRQLTSLDKPTTGLAENRRDTANAMFVEEQIILTFYEVVGIY
jgi:hypothetical protein